MSAWEDIHYLEFIKRIRLEFLSTMLGAPTWKRRFPCPSIARTRSFRFEATDGALVTELPAAGLDKADLIGYVPLEEALPVAFQLPLPLEGYGFMRLLKVRHSKA
jgi:hypothetical protein